MKAVLVVLAAVCLLGVAAACAVYWWFGRPLYSPGTVRREEGLGAPLEPPRDDNAPPGYLTVAPGIRLFTLRSGRGPAALVLHGGPGFCSEARWPGLAALEERFQLLYYHQRGCGKSTHPIDRLPEGGFRHLPTLIKSLGLAEQIADIERLRRLLGEDRIVLVGHSFGAFLAALYAGEFPERIRALILLAPADLVEFPPKGGGLFEDIRAELPPDMQEAYARYLKRIFDFQHILESDEASLAALQRDMIPFYAAAAQRRGFALPEDKMNDNGGWMVQGAYFSMGRSHDWSALLQGVTAPVMVVHGERDLQREEATRRYVGYFPNAQFVRLNNAGHFVHFDAPRELAQELTRFVERL